MKLNEMLSNLEKDFKGYWFEPDGTLHDLGCDVHEEWARKHDTTSAILLSKEWARVRIYQTAVMMETNKIGQIHRAIEMANNTNKKEIIFALHGQKTEYFALKNGAWTNDVGGTIETIYEGSTVAKLEDLLQRSQLDEAKAKSGGEDEATIAAFGTGYFVDPKGKLYNFGIGKTHANWASDRNQTVEELIGRGWTRMRNFNHPSMNYVQGDSNTISNIWYVIDLADSVGKSKIVYWVGKLRTELVKKNGKWETDDGRPIGELTESRLRTTPIITP